MDQIEVIEPEIIDMSHEALIKEEIEHLKELHGSARITPKFTRWVELFLDKPNNHGLGTYGNQTKSALYAYDLDETAKYGQNADYAKAGVIGSENIKKLKGLSATLLSMMGYTYGKHIGIAVKKYQKSNDPRWYNIVSELAGFPELESTKTNLTVNNTVNVNVNEGEQRDFNKEFLKFLESGTAANRGS